MEKIKIITDSTVDLPKDLLKELDIEVMPVLINFEEESYLDGIEMNTQELFDKMEKTNIFPTTAQIIPSRFEDIYKKYLDEGYKVLSIIMSSGMSGTYESACLAKKMLETEDVHIIDSQLITSGLGMLVLKAARLRDQGKSVEEIVEVLEDVKNRVHSSLSFESLDNLVRGGRLPKAVSVVTGLLGIRLILEIRDGVMALKGKVRGNKKAIKKIVADMEEFPPVKDMPVLLVSVGENDEIKNGIIDYLNEHNIEFIEGPVGCSVAIHSGKQAVGVFFIS